MINIITPAKLILSGEHAVVKGKPALLMAIPYFVNTSISAHAKPGVSLSGQHKSWEDLINIEIQLQHRYQSFVDNKIAITQVLQSPEELCWFSIIHILFHTHKIDYHSGIKITLETQIPIGCGMGSSAAVIISLMQCINRYYQLNLSATTLYQYALNAENLQHGRSSGADIKTIIEGGILLFQRHQTIPLTSKLFPFTIIHSGKPTSSTGECVARVNISFPAEHVIWNEFERCTKALVEALEKQSITDVKNAIRENHRLLKEIGVVPEKISRFIEKIEQQGGAAKICGAGSVSGDGAGVVMVIHDQDLTAVCEQFSYASLGVFSEAAHGILY
jgi:mevalonate kinase